jgi:hypothetical protein
VIAVGADEPELIRPSVTVAVKVVTTTGVATPDPLHREIPVPPGRSSLSADSRFDLSGGIARNSIPRALTHRRAAN